MQHYLQTQLQHYRQNIGEWKDRGIRTFIQFGNILNIDLQGMLNRNFMTLYRVASNQNCSDIPKCFFKLFFIQSYRKRNRGPKTHWQRSRCKLYWFKIAHTDGISKLNFYYIFILFTKLLSYYMTEFLFIAKCRWKM